MDRSEFVARVREGLGRDRTDPGLPPAFPPTPASGNGGATVERFAAQLAKVNGMARAAERRDLGRAVADVLREIPGSRRVVLSPDTRSFRPELDQGLELAGAEVVPDGDAGWVARAAGADWGITSARLGVASTGSVLLAAGPSAPRSTGLLPPAHLVLLPAGRLVAGLEEALAIVAAEVNTSSAAVLITGPSRTTDIEMTTVYGVHGPTVLRVLVVEEAR